MTGASMTSQHRRSFFPPPPPHAPAPAIAPGKGVVTVTDIAAFLGASRSSARRLICTLEAAGLKRKGAGAGSRWDKIDFLAHWRALDTRP